MKTEQSSQDRVLQLLVDKPNYACLGNLKEQENSNIREADLTCMTGKLRLCSGNYQQANVRLQEDRCTSTPGLICIRSIRPCIPSFNTV